jgi:hypothetical protein
MSAGALAQPIGSTCESAAAGLKVRLICDECAKVILCMFRGLQR